MIKELLEFNRPFSAIKLLDFAKNVKTELIILALEKSIELSNVVESNGMTIKHISSYDIHTLFKKIYDDENVETITVAKSECWYLPFIKDHIEPKYIILLLQPSVKPLEYGTSKEFKMPFCKLIRVLKYERYSWILLFCADNIHFDISCLAVELSGAYQAHDRRREL